MGYTAVHPIEYAYSGRFVVFCCGLVLVELTHLLVNICPNVSEVAQKYMYKGTGPRLAK